MNLIYRSAAILLYTLHYILKAERCIKPEFILYVSSYYLHCSQMLLRPLCMHFRIICTVLSCFFGLTYVFSYYLHCAQLLLRPQRLSYRKRAVIYLHIIVTYLLSFLTPNDICSENDSVF